MTSLTPALMAATMAALPVAADPVFSLAGTLPASGDYGAVLAAMEDTGAQATSLSLYWDNLQADGAYVADPDWPHIAQLVYPPQGIRIQLTFAVIDTLQDRRPPGLRGLAWDDPAVTEAFAILVQQTLSRMPDVDLVSVAIGNEVDGHLSGPAVAAYARFFAKARAAVHAQRPDTPVTIKVTWPGLRDRPDMLALARAGDGLSITWYPMDEAFHFEAPDVALARLDAMAALAQGPWELSEVGYPSGGCGAASPQTQAQFHTGLTAAAKMQPQLRLVQRVWSHDISPAEVAGYAGYYQTDAPCFTAFLANLGLRTGQDRAKPAFDALTRP